MRQSIKRIFTNLNIFMLTSLFIAILSTLLILEAGLSYEKIANLTNQKREITSLTKLDKKNITFSKIEFNSKSRKLLSDIDLLKSDFSFSFVSKYFGNVENEYMADLQNLKNLTTTFNNIANTYYVEDTTLEEEKLKSLQNARVNLENFIDEMLLKNIFYDEKKYYIIRNILILNMLFLLLGTFWYRKKIQAIYSDIRFLYTIDKEQNKLSYQIFSEEADAIALRMKRKSVTLDNPEMLDPVTEIYNYKGLFSAYNNRKGNYEANHIAVAILEIDSFSKSNRAFAQETTQAMLKKTAFTISLHEQPTDIIARTDYNQFTVILSRTNKKQLFTDLDLIRQSIEEIKFHTPNKGTVSITISGGFMVKSSKITLDEALKKAKEVLAHAISKGGNRISQTQDLIVFEDSNIPIA